MHHHVGAERDRLPHRGREHPTHRGPHLRTQVVRESPRRATSRAEHPLHVQTEGHGLHALGRGRVVGQGEPDLVTAGRGESRQGCERLHVAPGAGGQQHHAHPPSLAGTPLTEVEAGRVRSVA